MEHLSTGPRHDHNDQDAVTVAALTRREPLSPKHEQLADELLAAPEDDNVPLNSWLAFSALGVLLLVGAAAASGTILSRPAVAPRPAASAAPIGGVLALRPDLVREAQWPFAGNGGFASAIQTGGAGQEWESTEHRTANPSAGSDHSAINVVTEFYQRLDRDPDAAASLVSPTLLNGQRTQLEHAWDEVKSVRQRARSLSDGAVVAEVEAAYPEGDSVVLRQLLTVESGADPKIVGAELLSAQHVSTR